MSNSDRGLILAVVVLLIGVVVHVVNRLGDTNSQLLAATVTSTPKDYVTVREAEKSEDHGRTPAEQARYDQDMAMRREEEVKARATEMANEQLRGMGYDPRQIGT